MKKRADGRYAKQVMIGYHPDGKRKMKTIYGKTIKEVEKKEREIQNNINNGIFLIDNTITLEEWANKWLVVYKSNLEYNTVFMYKNAVETHIIPNIGMFRLCDIKTIHIQFFINNLLKTKGERVAQVCQMTIKQILKQAVKE